MCLIAKLRNLQEAILEGADDDLREAVLDRYRKIVDDPCASIGRVEAPQELFSAEEPAMDTDEMTQ